MSQVLHSTAEFHISKGPSVWAASSCCSPVCLLDDAHSVANAHGACAERLTVCAKESSTLAEAPAPPECTPRPGGSVGRCGVLVSGCLRAGRRVQCSVLCQRLPKRSILAGTQKHMYTHEHTHTPEALHCLDGLLAHYHPRALVHQRHRAARARLHQRHLNAAAFAAAAAQLYGAEAVICPGSARSRQHHVGPCGVRAGWGGAMELDLAGSAGGACGSGTTACVPAGLTASVGVCMPPPALSSVLATLPHCPAGPTAGPW